MSGLETEDSGRDWTLLALKLYEMDYVRTDVESGITELLCCGSMQE